MQGLKQAMQAKKGWQEVQEAVGAHQHAIKILYP